MFKAVLAPILAVTVTAVLAVSALAAGPTGPQHYNLSGQQCSTKGDYSICSTSSGEETDVQTAPGTFSSDVNMTNSFVVTVQGAPFASGSSVLHAHELFTNNFGVLQEAGIHQSSTQTFGGSTCTYSADLHVTQLDPSAGTGHIQYDNFNYVCV